jgi:hypothetical protein
LSFHRPARFAVLIAAVAVLVAAAPAGAAVRHVSGTVVLKTAATHSFVVASSSGRLRKIFATHLPAVGRFVRVTASSSGGDLKAKKIKVGARRRHTKLRGTIVYKGKGRFTLSADGALILVKVKKHHASLRDDPSASDPSSSSTDGSTDTPAAPAVGNQVIVVSAIDPSGDLAATDVQELGQDTGTIKVEGAIDAIDATTGLVSVSANEDDPSGAAVTLQMFDGFDFSTIAVGDRIEWKLKLQTDGTYAVVEILDPNDEEGETPGS